MAQETLRVWLISRELRHMPHKARIQLASNFDMRCPLPCELSIPAGSGEKPKFFVRRFALIQGGETPKILAVYYIETEPI